MIVRNILSHSRFNGSPFFAYCSRRQPSGVGSLEPESLPDITGVLPKMMAGIIISAVRQCNGSCWFPVQFLWLLVAYDMMGSRFADRSSDWIMPAGWSFRCQQNLGSGRHRT